MSDTTTTVKSLEQANESDSSRYRLWVDEINMAEKELSDWHKQASSIVKRYKDDRSGLDELERKFNIFTANVGIMQASLFSKIPKADVSRRFAQANDDPARVAAMMIQNCLFQDMEDEDCNFVETVKGAITDRLVPGCGVAWVRLETEVEEDEIEAQVDPVTGETITEAATYERVVRQEVCIEYVHYDDLIWSPCRVWSERRWIGRIAYMDQDSLVERFGEEKGKAIPLDYNPKSKSDTNQNNPVNDILQKAIIYEIWDRQTKKVLWISKGYEGILDEKDDPLKLEDFDPMPKPLFALQTTDNTVPVPDFVIIQDQYNELDLVNNRISLLVSACKVVGVYDSAATGVQRLLAEGVENTLVPVDNWAMFAEKGGIKGQVDWLPIDQVIAALERLRQAREDIKGQIYELTGISDIVRGNTKASETLGAQQIKAQFASVRIQKLQDEVALFVQKLLQLKAEIICKHFTPMQILEQSNFKYYLDGPNAPLVHQALQLIKGDEDKFNWRVKVQVDSLAQPDYAQQKQERVELINAVATFLQSAATTMKAVPDSAPMLFETLKFTIAGFKGAAELEGVIDQNLAQIMQKIQNPPPPPPDPAVQKMQAEMQKMQAEFQLEVKRMQQEMQMEQQRLRLEMETKQQEMAFKQQEHQMDLAFKAQEHQQEVAQDREKFDQQIAQDSAKAMLEMTKAAREDNGEIE